MGPSGSRRASIRRKTASSFSGPISPSAKQQEERMRESESLLQESEDRLRLAVEAVDAGHFRFLSAHRRAALVGSLQGTLWIAAGSRGRFRDFPARTSSGRSRRGRGRVARTLQPGSDGRFDIEYRTIGIEDGKERWIAAKGLVFFDLTGTAARFIGTVLDITRAETRRARTAARETRGGGCEPRERSFPRHAFARTAHAAHAGADDDRDPAPRSGISATNCCATWKCCSATSSSKRS